MLKCPLRYAKVFDKCSCIGNDWEARQKFHNGENLQKGMYNVVCNSNYIIAQFLLYNCCIKIMVDTCKIMENVHMTKVIFLHHFCD